MASSRVGVVWVWDSTPSLTLRFVVTGDPNTLTALSGRLASTRLAASTKGGN
jgi:hypothetical protein